MLKISIEQFYIFPIHQCDGIPKHHIIVIHIVFQKMFLLLFISSI